MKKKRKLRNSVKAVIIDDGKILLLQKDNGKGGYTVLPGGGQEFGETLHQALKREVFEEIGAKIKIGKLLHIREYFSEKHDYALEDREIHQVEFFFKCKLVEAYKPKNGHFPDPHQKEVVWVSLDKLDEANFYPTALRKILPDLKHNDAPIYLGECN
ncbi:MAG: NUDIX domain-containing protein [Anaerolineaceae bacterium]|jgi:8-oxo-dGTP pyrophosphatase MutT (NUDIX family)|nr:NUDIX domain-containing protein [Anaerolineaceae bacterium]MDD4042575.1 NUDIX domain-containing protein [Anaerolineaceae bacterium]MDD4577750.1 NUDIX domain-containing protein [Anaerolineaceae bacterium]